jgi:hypothetical protein
VNVTSHLPQCRSLREPTSLTPSYLFTALLLVLAALPATKAGAQPAAPETSTTGTLPSVAKAPLEFRRVFVPADQTADWPTGGAQYLPLERAEFERLVEQAEQRRQLERVGNAQLVDAEYTARLAESDLLGGVAKLDVQAIDDQPCILPLEPWNAVVLGGRWLGQADAAEPSPATLGLWSHDDGQPDSYGLLVDRSGQVEIDWQAAPERRGDQLEFLLRMPTAVTQRLALDLPPGATPTMTSGRVIEQSAAPQGAGRRWTFQLAAGAEHRLQISRPAAADAATEAASLPLAATIEAYRLTPDGADYEAELRIQERGSPLPELRIQVPPTLHVAAVAVNRQTAEWRRDPEEAATLIISLPSEFNRDGAHGALATVAISGAAAVTFDAPWTLPSVAPQGVFWTEGTSTLWVDPTLEIRSLTPRECSLLNVVGVGSGDAGEVYRLQSWSPAASAELVVGDRRQSVRHRSGVTVEFAERELIASADAVLWSEGGRTFHLAAPLAEQWSIESVNVVPADGLIEWHVEEGEARRLHLQLRRSPTAAFPLRLTVNARKPWRAWTRMASLGDLDFLQLPGSGDDRWLVAKDRRGKEIIPDAKLTEAIVPAADLSVAAKERLGGSADGLIINLNEAPANALVSVASTAVTFAGEAWMELATVAAGYEHRAEILCRPATGAVSELRLMVARELPPDVAWELEDGGPLAVERISPAPSPAAATTTASPSGVIGAAATTAAVPNSPIEYRLRLPQPRTAPFRVRATWRSVAAADSAVNLISLPDAQSWQAWAIFRGHASQVAVAPRGAAASVALPPQTAADELPAIACFRLGDDPAAASASPPAFIPLAATQQGPGATDRSVTAGAVAWRCDAATEQLADGTQNHRIDYQIEAREPTEVQLAIPPGETSFTSVILDGRTLIASPAPDARAVRFRLAGAPHLQTLTVALQRKTPPLARSAKVWPAIPRASFPVLRGNWTIRWPVAYDAATRPVAQGSSDVEPADWLSRLFGPLSGRGGQRWYDGMLLAHVDAASTSAPLSAGNSATPGGWNSLTLSFVNRPAPVELRLASGDQANWHVAWLIAAVAAGWLWARSRRSAVLLIAATVVVCLIVPEAIIPLPQAMFLGLVTGVVVRQLVSFLTKPRAAGGTRSTLAGAPATWAVIILAASIASPLSAIAQTPIVAAPPTTPPTTAAPTTPASAVASPKIPPQVLFPVDNEGKPVGADVYVPASMAAELLPVAVGPPAALVDARYQVELQAAGPASEIVAHRVQLRFRWRSHRAQSRVELPLAAAAGVLDPATLLLNGQPIVPQWNETATSLALVLPQPGQHELTATLSPIAALATDAGERSRFQLHIPRLAGATVEVVHPAGLGDVRVADAAPSANQANATRTIFRLGSTSLLDLTWSTRLEREVAGVAVEQLSVLEVDPVAARLNIRLRLTGDAAPVRSLRLALAPQLKLLPLPEGSPLEAAAVQLSDGEAAGTIHLRFRSPPVLPLTFSLQFQVQRTLSVGRIDYPWVDVLGMNVRSRHFAVIADPRLRVRDAAVAGLTPVAAAELEPLWGAAVAGASVRYAAATPTPDWSLDVAPAPPRFTSRESAELHCGGEEIRFAYSAAISDVDGELLVHRFIVPSDLQIDRATATLDGPAGDIPVRWSRPQADQLQLFLSRPLSEPHVVRIEGRVSDAIAAAPASDVADAGVLPVVERHVQVPRISLEVAQATPIDLLLFRTGDVLVDWSSPAPVAKPLAGSLDPTRGLFVGQFSLPRGDAAAPELRVVRNDAGYEADALLTLQLDAVEPIAECRLEGRATRGMVDRVRLVVGKNWRGPFTCDPPARVTSRNLAADADRQTLDVRLARPIPAGEAFSLVIRGPVALETDQRIRFPALQLANAERQRIYLMLPPTAGNLTAEWTLRGLTAQPLSDGLTKKLGAERPPLAYRVQRERFVAEQRVFPDAMRSPAYRLAESRVALGTDGAAALLAQLIVQGGGSDDCRITFPVGARLEYISVDGAFQPRPASGDQVWRAPAGSRFLPRVLLFSYRLPPSEPGSPRRFEPLQVSIDGKPLAPETSLWQIDDAGGLTPSQPDVKLLSEAQFAAVARQKQIDAFLDAYPLGSQLAEWELQIWRQPWLDRLSVADAAVAANDPAAWTRLRDRLAAAMPIRAVTPIDPVRQWSQGTPASARFFAGGLDGAVTLTPIANPWPIARWLAALTLAAAIGVAWRQPAALRNLTLPAKRWPYAALAAAGFFWWLLLAPSALGLLLIAFSIAAYLKSRR